ncbi:MAG: helix-turn-helix domain containing protein [Proteobacteria bacterium]|nr:helix-turn-helix domain containing protein [Pseudomonadota bacterium]
MEPRSGPTPITLSAKEQAQLGLWSGEAHGSTVALRAHIVLCAARGMTHREIAAQLGCTAQTVGKWRARFAAQRLAGLTDAPRSGAPRTISDAVVAAVLAKTLHEPPPDATRWSSRRLAQELGLSQRAVLRIWRTFDL